MLGAHEQRDAVVYLFTTIAAERAAMDQWFLGQGEGESCTNAIIPTMERLWHLRSRLGIIVGDPMALAILSQKRHMPAMMQGKR